MSFYDVYSKYKVFNINEIYKHTNEGKIQNILNKDKINELDFLTLLSPVAERHLEDIARKAHELSLKHFGKSILLYTPLYLSNYCVNKCAYCSYNAENHIKRKTLTFEELRNEAMAIAKTGLRHILILTGESRKEAPLLYIIESVKILREHFDSISIEIYPLQEAEYEEVIAAGVDEVTIYQEVYDEDIYDKVHILGPKKNYRFRLDAPERACKSKIRRVNIGSLLGLNEWLGEVFLTGLHAQYLQNKYSDVELSISFPRIRPHVGAFNDIVSVNDRNLVQIMLALRVFLPYVGMTISTRENMEFRDNLIPLGVTKMSAGVSTEVGGHTLGSKGESQFEISDNRSVGEIKKAILLKGYQPILKDWMKI